MSQNVNLVRRAMLEQDPNTLGQLATELFQRDPLNNDFRAMPPVFVTGVCGASINTGDLVYVSSASGGTMTFALALAADASKMPAFGIVEYKQTSTSCVVRPITMIGEYTTTGLTAGSTYVVGTDGRLAKSGGTYYPANGAAIQPVGIAISTTALLILPGLPVAGSALGLASYFRTSGDSADLTNTTTETNVDSIITTGAVWNKVGRRFQFLAAVKHSGTNAGDKIQFRVRETNLAGTLLLDSGLVAPLATGDTTVFRGIIEVTAIGATGKVNGIGQAAATVATAPNSVTLNTSQATVDTTAATRTLWCSLKWNAASASNHAILQSLHMDVL